MNTTQALSITGMTLEELTSLCTSKGEPAYRAGQILSWIYNKGANRFDQMSNLPKGLRRSLAEDCQIYQTGIDRIIQSDDGTEKFLIRLPDENKIECILMREGKRVTVCVSTQVGCAMACRFCASGLLGLERNLSAGEIIEQVLFAKSRLSSGEHLTNIVFMGTGEPLLNYNAIIKAIRILNAEWGLGIGARHITISTVGIPGKIRKLAHEKLQINLAISLHAPDDVIRAKIIPSNTSTGIQNILAAAREYFEITRRDITFEYTLIDGINASRQDAESLAQLLKGIQCNINLLPLNPVKEFDLKPPSQKIISTFYNTLSKQGMIVTIRKKKGDAISAACGQLRLQQKLLNKW